MSKKTPQPDPEVTELFPEPTPLPDMPARFLSGGATAEERAAWIAAQAVEHAPEE